MLLRLGLLLSCLSLAIPAAAQTVLHTAWISEIHYDNAGDDVGEFVEITIPANDDPSRYQLDFYATSNFPPVPDGGAYVTIPGEDWVLAGADAGKFFYLVGSVETPDYLSVDCTTFPGFCITSTISNSTAGVALSRDGELLEFLSYEGTFTGVGGPADGVTSVEIGFQGTSSFIAVNENSATPVGRSLQRSRFASVAPPPDGSNSWCGPYDDTRGEVNVSEQSCLYVSDNQTPVTTSATPGWRLLSVGRRPAESLATRNLVSGIPGFDVGENCSITNIFTGYTGDRTGPTGGYTAPTSGSDILETGAGFFWYFFGDPPAAGFPSACGATPTDPDPSTTQALPFSIDIRVIDKPLAGTFPGNVFPDDAVYTVSDAHDADGFYMLGNPYQTGFDLSGLTADVIDLQAAVSVWNPTEQRYDVVLEMPQAVPAGHYDTVYNPGDGDDLSLYQGFFAERFGPDPATDVTFRFDEYAQQSDYLPLTAKRTAPSATAIGFEVTNGDVSGAASLIRFADGAGAGWDRYDLSKLSSPESRHATIGPVGITQDGSTAVKAVESRAATLGAPVSVPLSFTTSEPDGPFILSWPDLGLPADWTVTLFDLDTGQTIPLAPGGSYGFEHRTDADPDRFLVTISPLPVGTESLPTAGLDVSSPMPNPVTDRLSITVTAGTPQRLVSDVFDMRGRRVLTVDHGEIAGGAARRLGIDTHALAPGVYAVRISGDATVETRRFLVAR